MCRLLVEPKKSHGLLYEYNEVCSGFFNSLTDAQPSARTARDTLAMCDFYFDDIFGHDYTGYDVDIICCHSKMIFAISECIAEPDMIAV